MSAAVVPILEFSRPVFLHGRNTTVRRGRKWHGTPAAHIRLADGSASPPVSLDTQVKRFDRLLASDIQCEHDPGCRQLDGLLAMMRQLYPGFSPDEEVTLCHFQLP